MREGYNKRIRIKLRKLDGDFDLWHFAIRELAHAINKDSSRGAIKNALARYKKILRFNNNAYYKSTRTHCAIVVAKDWNTCMAKIM